MSQHSEIFYDVNAHGIRLVHRFDGHEETRTFYDENDRIGLYYDQDNGGCLHKHGQADKVAEIHRKHVQTMGASFPELAASLVFFAFPATLLRDAEIRETLNHAIASSGRINHAVARIQELAAALPEDRQRAIAAVMAIPA